MSVAWDVIKRDLTETVVGLTGVTPTQVKWRDEAEGGTWLKDPTIFLHVNNIEDVGFPYEDRVQPDATSDAIVTLVQPKKFTVTVRAESFTQDIADPNHAGTLLGTLKTRMHRSTTTFSLESFAIWLYGRTHALNYVDKSGRKVCAYLFEMTCGTVDLDVDTTQGAGGFINEIQNTGTVNNAAGASPATVTLDVKGV